MEKKYILYGKSSENKNMLYTADSGVIGGSYEDMLREQIEKYGAENLLLKLEPISSDFSLPSNSGNTEEVKPNMNRRFFYSRELEINYYSYIRDNTAHFVLFDNANSIRRKIQIAEGMGIKNIMLSREELKSHGIDLREVFSFPRA